MEIETLLECTQEMDKTTRKESVSMEIVDTESSSDTGQEKIGQKVLRKNKKSLSLSEYLMSDL